MDSNFSSFININVFSSYNIIIFLHLHHKNIHPEYRCLNFWQNLHASGGGARREAMNESPRSFAKVCWALGANTRLIALRSYGMMKFGVVDNEVCKCPGAWGGENSSPPGHSPAKTVVCESCLWTDTFSQQGHTQVVSDPTTPRDKVRQVDEFSPDRIFLYRAFFSHQGTVRYDWSPNEDKITIVR